MNEPENSPHLDQLLVALSQGDPDAAEAAYRTYEPYLRMLVRRKLTPSLRARFDSVDVVQSAWADLLDGFRANRWQFQDAAQLRGFLARVTGNRFLDRVRQHNSAANYERIGGTLGQAAASRPDSPSEVVQGDELWQKMLEACPPAHRELLQLRREGLTTAEIGARVGLNEGSVRRALGNIARRLALQARPDDGADAPGPPS